MIKAIIFDKFGLFVGPYEKEMLALADELRSKEVKVYLLSNAGPDGKDQLEQYFDKQYYSGETGVLKPDPQAYLQILDENNLQAEECLFFDDSQLNVDGANRIGIQGFLFENAEQVDFLFKKFRNSGYLI